MRSAGRRHAAAIRVVALFLLLWVGFDIGAHGLLAADLAPFRAGGCCTRLTTPDSGPTSEFAHDHCFCHGLSVGAVLPALAEALAPAGIVALPFSSQVPGSDGNPLDHPPQLHA